MVTEAAKTRRRRLEPRPAIPYEEPREASISLCENRQRGAQTPQGRSREAKKSGCESLRTIQEHSIFSFRIKTIFEISISFKTEIK